MIKISDKALCCGCSACAHICPQNCISIDTDTEGFRYPKVDILKCVNCNLCNNVCPISKKTVQNDFLIESYVAINKNKTVKALSSSGGVFYALAEFVLSNGGIVFGAAFDKNMMVKHLAVNINSELYKLMGSKYLESDLGDSFTTVKKLLEKNLLVLFSGTPCQVAGLNSFLNRDYSNLITVDVLCHGVPSPSIWSKYLDFRTGYNGTQISDISFRNKENGWKNYNVIFTFNDGSKYSSLFYNDPYMQMFLRDICLRPSCYNCHFKEMDRTSDFTIGDAWGIEKKLPEFDDDSGTSLLFVHSNKGSKILEYIKGDLIIKKGDLDYLLPPNAASRNSVGCHPNRAKVFKALSKGEDFNSLYKFIKPSFFLRCKYLIKRIFKMLLKIIRKYKNTKRA